MAEIGEIKPTAPIWPVRQDEPRKERRQEREQPPKRREDADPDEDGPTIDEYV